MDATRPRHWLIAVGSLASLGCWGMIRALGDVRRALGSFYGWFAIAFGVYLVILWLVRHSERAMAGARPRSLGTLTILLIGAAGARLLLLPTRPVLSDDIYRYEWDGRVQQAGIDPYAHAPDDPAVAFLRDEDWSHINFPHLRTIYPPLTERAFWLGTALGGGMGGQKLVFVLAELLTVLSLLVILRRRGRSPLWVAAYAWHPLVILEIAGSGHNDALGIAMLWVGVAAWETRRWAGAAYGWAAACASKFLSVILVPWWWCRRTARGWLVAFLVLCAAPIVCCPTIIAAVVGSLSAMATRFESNASVYVMLASGLGDAALARVVAAGLWVVFAFRWARRQDDPARYLLGALLAAALLSPVLHPWYVLWLIPCLCFWRPPAAVMLSGSVVLAYTVWPSYLAGGRWAMPVWAIVLEYLPVLAVLLWGIRPSVSRSLFQLATKPKRSAAS